MNNLFHFLTCLVQGADSEELSMGKILANESFDATKDVGKEEDPQMVR